MSGDEVVTTWNDGNTAIDNGILVLWHIFRSDAEPETHPVTEKGSL